MTGGGGGPGGDCVDGLQPPLGLDAQAGNWALDGDALATAAAVEGPLDGARLRAGDTAVVSTKNGPRMVTVLKVGMSVVDVDLNHPMAGKTLAFAIEVVDVRAATAEELEHHHVHGEGGHQH